MQTFAFEKKSMISPQKDAKRKGISCWTQFGYPCTTTKTFYASRLLDQISFRVTSPLSDPDEKPAGHNPKLGRQGRVCAWKPSSRGLLLPARRVRQLKTREEIIRPSRVVWASDCQCKRRHTVQGSKPAYSDTVKSDGEGRHMKQLLISSIAVF